MSVVVVVYFLVLVVYFLTVDWLPFLQVHPYIASYDHELLVQLLGFSASYNSNKNNCQNLWGLLIVTLRLSSGENTIQSPELNNNTGFPLKAID